MKNERRKTFGARKALAIVGSLETRLYREHEKPGIDRRALRRADKLVLDAVDGQRSVREVIATAGLDYDAGLHSVAWLTLTGFLYSGERIKKLLSQEADRLALFVELFSDAEHDLKFWQAEIMQATKSDPALAKLAPGLTWENLTPKLATPIPSPSDLKEYFLHLFVALYDRAEGIFGTQSVLAKRILLDVRPWL